MRYGLRRYLTARRGWWALAAVLVTATATVLLARSMASSTSLSNWWVPVATIPPMIAGVFVYRTLSGDDVALERSMPRLRPAWRAAHATVTVVLCCLPLAVAAVATLSPAGASAVVRNTVGLSGMFLLSATAVRPAAAWMPPVGYGFLVLAVAPHEPGGAGAWWAWPVQPGPLVVPWIVAALLLGAGMTVYPRRGPAG